MADRSRAAVVDQLRSAGCVFAEDEADLLMAAAGTPTHLAAMVERRTGGVPLEQILGWVEFCGLRIEIDEGVFVPRRRTQFLVEQAAALTHPHGVVVDMCCGSGAVGAAVGASCTSVELYAVDVDPVAVRCARRNLVGAHVYEGDLFEPLPRALQGRVDVVVANVPYVPTREIAMLPPEARAHEPHVALDGGSDGLDVFRRVAAAAHEWLAPGGHLLVETSTHQAPHAVDVVERHGLVARVVRAEEANATVVVSARPRR